MSELKKYVDKINELIKKYRQELHGSTRDDKVLHLETIKFRLENEIENTKSYEENSVFRKAMEQSIEERYKHETDNAESFINHVVNPANDVETLLAETALVDIKPVIISSQGASTADAVYVSNSNVVGYVQTVPGETQVANDIKRILNDDSSKGIGNPDIMVIIINGLLQGDANFAGVGGSDADTIANSFRNEMKMPNPVNAATTTALDRKRAKFIHCLNIGPHGIMSNFIKLVVNATFLATRNTIRDFLSLCICGTEASKNMVVAVNHIIKDDKICNPIIAGIQSNANVGFRSADLVRLHTEHSVRIFIAKCLTRDAANIGGIMNAINASANVAGLASNLSATFRYINDNGMSNQFVRVEHLNSVRFQKILAASICTDDDLTGIISEIIGANSIAALATVASFQNIATYINHNTAAGAGILAGAADANAAKMFFKNRTRGVEYEKVIAAALCVPGAANLVLVNTGTVFENHGTAIAVPLNKIVDGDEYIKKIISHINDNAGSNDSKAAALFINSSGIAASYQHLIASSLCSNDIHINIADELFLAQTNAGPNPVGIDGVAADVAFIAIMTDFKNNLNAAIAFIENAEKNIEFAKLVAAVACIAGDYNTLLDLTKGNDRLIIQILKLIDSNAGRNTVAAGSDKLAAPMLITNIPHHQIYEFFTSMAVCLSGTNECTNIAGALIGPHRIAALAANGEFKKIMTMINVRFNGDFNINLKTGKREYELIASAALCVDADYSAIIDGSIIADEKIRSTKDLAGISIVGPIMGHINDNNELKMGGHFVADDVAADLFIKNSKQSDEYRKLIAASLCILADYSNIATKLNTIDAAATVSDAASKQEFINVLNHIGINSEEEPTEFIKNIDKAAYQQTWATALCASDKYDKITNVMCKTHTVASLFNSANFMAIMVHIGNNTGGGNDAAAKLFLANVKDTKTYINLYAAALCSNNENFATSLFDAKNIKDTASDTLFLKIMKAIRDNMNDKGNKSAVAAKDVAINLFITAMAGSAGRQRLLASALCVKDLDAITDILCKTKSVMTLAADTDFVAIMKHINDNTGTGDGEAAKLFATTLSTQSKINIYAAALCIAGDNKRLAEALCAEGKISDMADNKEFIPVINALNGNFVDGTFTDGAAANAFAALAFNNDGKYSGHRTVLAAALCVNNNISNITAALLNLGNISILAANIEINVIVKHINDNTDCTSFNNDNTAANMFHTLLEKSNTKSDYIQIAKLMLCAKGDYSNLIGNIIKSIHLPEIAEDINTDTAVSQLLINGHTRSTVYESLIAEILCIDKNLETIAGNIMFDYKTPAMAAQNTGIINIARKVDTHTNLGHFMKNTDKAGYSLALSVFLCADNTVLTNIPDGLIKKYGVISKIATQKEMGDIFKNINDNTGAVVTYAAELAKAMMSSPPAVISPPGSGNYVEDAAILFTQSAKKKDKNYRILYAAALCNANNVNIGDAFFYPQNRISELATDSEFIEIITFIEDNHDSKGVADDGAVDEYMKVVNENIHAVVLCIDAAIKIRQKEYDTPPPSKYLQDIAKKIDYDFCAVDTSLPMQNNATKLFMNINKDMTNDVDTRFLINAMIFERDDSKGGHDGAASTNIWHLVCNDGTLLSSVVKNMESIHSKVTSVLLKILSHGDTGTFDKSDKDKFLAEVNQDDGSGRKIYPNLQGALGTVTTKTGGGYSLMDYPERLGGILALGGIFLNMKSLVFVVIVLLIMLILFMVFDSNTKPKKPDQRALTYFPLC